MLDRVNAAMVELQGALLARAWYPAGHPRIRNGEEKALALIDEVLRGRTELELFAVDNRIIFESRILPASANLADTLFRALRASGVDRLSFRRGLESEELSRFLDDLAGGLARKDHRLQPCAHIGFGSLQEVNLADYDASLDCGPALLGESDETTRALAEVWKNVEQSGRLDSGVLGDVVTSMSRVVSSSGGAILPLAPLKRHDEYTFVHTINVAMLSTALGEALGFDSRSAHDLSIAALLHDVGKRAIPKEILNKAGRFSEEEFRIMKSHTVEGARILLSTPNVPEIAPIVAYEHHIRADGSGYPRVPRGWRLSLASRIVQIADVFDALRTDRPYRPGQPVSKIVEIMRRDVGSFFDADLLLVFLQSVVSRGVPVSRIEARQPTA